jgi:peptidoglycan/xylan/chitin deacetylase (PgdA/CDA1 family)
MFTISRFLMRRRLMILGYHGFQYSDEASFRPILFMSPQRFARRLEILKRGNYPVLPLAEGVRRYKNGTLPANAVTITIDDGFFSVLDIAAPMLRKHRFPATLYVTSYYLTKGTPIFRLVIQYLFWKTECKRFEPLDRAWSPTTGVDLEDIHAAHQAMWQIIDYGETNCDENQRQKICAEVAAALGLDFEAIRDGRGLSLLAPDELCRLADFGIDVQLHTHRHSFPSNDLERARRELHDNRVVLQKILGHRLEHFCYPSGVWERNVLPMLSEEGIISATTCQAGMNHRTTDPFALYRVLDQDNLHDIEFEAELSGFCELIRIVTGQRRSTDKKHGVKT